MGSEQDFTLPESRVMFKHERIKSKNLDKSINGIPLDISFAVDTKESKIADMRGSFDQLKERNLIYFGN